MSAGHVLLVDHNRETVYRLRSCLTEAGFDFLHAPDAESALARVTTEDPDVVLTEWQLRDRLGAAFVSELREQSRVPVVVLTAHNDGKTAIRALRAGADDVLFKPCNPEELSLRLRVQIRRYVPEPKEPVPVITVGPLSIDRNLRHVALEGRTVHLAPREFDVLRVLAEQAGRVVPTSEIVWRVWGRQHKTEKQPARLYVRYLRRKIPGLIRTNPPVGYYLATEASDV